MLTRHAYFLLFMLLFHLVPAQVPTRFSYSESFGMADGLAHTVVADMTIDRNDLLWIAVNGTLQLFDGDQFINMGHLIHSSNSIGFFGFEKGKDVFLVKDNVLYKFTPDQYTSQEAPNLVLPSISRRDPNPRIIYEDGQYLYIAHPNDSLYQVEKKTLLLRQTLAFTHKPHPIYTWSSIYVPPDPVSSIPYLDSSFRKCTFDLSSGRLSIDPSCPNAGRAALASGDTMLVLQPLTLDIYGGGHKHTVPLPERGKSYNGAYFLVSGRDSVFVSLDNGIYIFNLRKMSWESRLQRTGGKSFAEVRVRSMVIDQTGHLYFSTFNTGLVKMYLENEGFQYLGVEGNKKYFIKCLRVSDVNNLVLAGTLDDGLLVFDTNGVLIHHIKNLSDHKTLGLVSAIIKLSEDKYLLFADHSYIFNWNEGHYLITPIRDSTHDRLSYYDQALEDYRHHRYFIFNHNDFIEFGPGPTEKALKKNIANFGASISVVQSGDFYVVSAYDELIFYDQDFKGYPIKFNVPDFGYSRCLVSYAKGKFLVATDLGLFILDTLQPMKPQLALYHQRVYGILPGTLPGEFWFSTDFGLYRLNPDLTIQQFSIESGLQESEFNTNSCYKSKSGKLYFGGVNGITTFYPGQISKQDDHPLAYISIFSINGEIRERYIPPDKISAYTLSSNENVIRLRFLGRGKRSPRSYNFQYQVKELHDHWIDLGHNMDIQFQLTPGHHTIYYHIADQFQPDAPFTNRIQLYIRPPVYQRWWFQVLILLLPAAILYYVVDTRRKRLALRLRYERELQDELHDDRVRISRELHDNIGAQMATVKRNINFLIDHNEQLSTDQIKTKMKDLEGISSQINQELRDTIWAVQNEHITLSGFISRFKNYVFQVIGPEHPVRVLYHESIDHDPLLGPLEALNLHRICQEAINNTLKHAGASEIHISYQCTRSGLHITIADNGIGFDARPSYPGFGLNNIRKRAEQIHAEVSFNQLHEKGSSLEILMPLPTK